MFVDGNTNSTVYLLNNINKGNITGSGSATIGGIVGILRNNVGIVFNMKNNTNTKSVTGSNNYGTVGGLIGQIDVTGSTVTIDNGLNTADVITEGNTAFSASGIVGLIGNCGSGAVKITLKNCENMGKVDCSQSMSQGLVGVENEKTNVSLIILNSVNKGFVNGKEACGIANNVSEARNVVSIGKPNGTKKYVFWINNSVSSNCYTTQSFSASYCEKLTKKNQIFVINKTNKPAYWTLNSYAINNSYDCLWNSSLDLHNRFHSVYFIKPVDLEVFVPDGYRLQDGSPSEGDEWEEILDTFGRCFIQNKNHDEINLTTCITTDLKVQLNNTVFASGVINDTFSAGRKTLLGGIFNDSVFEEYILFDTNNSRIMYNANNTVKGDMYISITKTKVVEIELEMNDEYNEDEIIYEIKKELTDFGIPVKDITVTISDDKSYYIINVTVSDQTTKDEINQLNACEK